MKRDIVLLGKIVSEKGCYTDTVKNIFFADIL